MGVQVVFRSRNGNDLAVGDDTVGTGTGRNHG